MCNTPGLGGGSQQSSAQSGLLSSPGNPRQDIAQRNFLNSLLGYDFYTGQGISSKTGKAGEGVGGALGQLQARTTLPTGYTTPELTSTGLLQEQQLGLQQPFLQAVEQALGRTSGNFAQRGFLRPENIQAIAGSAAQNVAPQFAQLYANLAGQNVMQRTQAPLIQEEITRQRFADLLNILGMTGNAGGGSMQTSSGVTNSNWLGGVLGGAAQGAGGAATKWALG